MSPYSASIKFLTRTIWKQKYLSKYFIYTYSTAYIFNHIVFQKDKCEVIWNGYSIHSSENDRKSWVIYNGVAFVLLIIFKTSSFNLSKLVQNFMKIIRRMRQIWRHRFCYLKGYILKLHNPSSLLTKAICLPKLSILKALFW